MRDLEIARPLPTRQMTTKSINSLVRRSTNTDILENAFSIHDQRLDFEEAIVSFQVPIIETGSERFSVELKSESLEEMTYSRCFDGPGSVFLGDAQPR